MELVLEDAPCCAVEEEMNVILDPSQKLFHGAVLVPVLNGQQENGAR